MTRLKPCILILLFALIGCDENDDIVNDVNDPDGFTYNSTFYETVNAYISIDDDDDNNDGQPDSYSFFFTNGRMFDNDANVNNSSGDYLYSTNTTELVFLQILVSDNPSLSQFPPTAGNTYTASSTDDSVIIHDGDIVPLLTQFVIDSVEFGQGSETIGTFHFPGVVGPTLTINQLHIDVNVPENSMIDAEYSFMNQNGEYITGHYEGSFGAMLD